jgi:SAM-dependent methyltransferase
MQSKSILYKILSYPLFYDIFVKLIAKKGGRQKFVDNYLKPFPGMKIVDLGCGPGSIIEYLPEQVEYVGVDAEKNYIDSAINKYGEIGKFICEDILSFSPKEVNYFDIAIAIGLLHHLNDEESKKLIEAANKVLKPGGCLVTIDNIYIKNQSFIARFLISKDRGKNVRTLDQYLRIGQTVFPKIEYQIIHDMLRVPYTHIIMTMTT